jgi:dolichol kinase
MYQNDWVGVAAVYIYVALLILFTEKVLSKKYPVQSRKFLHIMTGNIAFILPLFETKEIMAFIAAGPFILFTFLMSPYSPIKSMRGKTSEAGHGLGLVYYAITWTVLAYVFFDHREIIAMAILAMSYGDGLASLIGIKYGQRKYTIFKDTKSYVGSFAMFIFTFLLFLVALGFYVTYGGTPAPSNIIRVTVYFLCMAGIVTVVEGITPLGLDNLSVPFITAVMYWFYLVG